VKLRFPGRASNVECLTVDKACLAWCARDGSRFRNRGTLLRNCSKFFSSACQKKEAAARPVLSHRKSSGLNATMKRSL